MLCLTYVVQANLYRRQRPDCDWGHGFSVCHRTRTDQQETANRQQWLVANDTRIQSLQAR